jgi:hypothetical protein
MAAADATPERPDSTDLLAKANVRTPPDNDQYIDGRACARRLYDDRSAVQGHCQRHAVDEHG